MIDKEADADVARDILLDSVAEACYSFNAAFESEGEAIEEVLSDPVSFLSLVKCYLYLYGKYRGMNSNEVIH